METLRGDLGRYLVFMREIVIRYVFIKALTNILSMDNMITKDGV